MGHKVLSSLIGYFWTQVAGLGKKIIFKAASIRPSWSVILCISEARIHLTTHGHQAAQAGVSQGPDTGLSQKHSSIYQLLCS